MFISLLGHDITTILDLTILSLMSWEATSGRAKTPPYTGYGSWDDSMGSVTHLIPKLPKKDGSSRADQPELRTGRICM